MSCEAPLKAYRPAAGGSIRFWRPKDGRAWIALDIPCGRCILCREEQARQWAVRISHEAQLHPQNSFVTLTYRDDQVPEHNSLDYKHLVKFWKRLRKNVGPLRYYAVGEYGDQSLRPHYHACIFGMDFLDGAVMAKTGEHPQWVSPLLTKTWGHGDVRVLPLTFETARYTASYVTKKLRSKQQYVRTDEETGELIPLVQPRAFMSRNIAKTWWKKFNQGVRDHDWVIINGKPQKPPRAYDRWLSEVNEEEHEKMKEKRKKQATKLTQTETRARAQNAHARTKRKSKSI